MCRCGWHYRFYELGMRLKRYHWNWRLQTNLPWANFVSCSSPPHPIRQPFVIIHFSMILLAFPFIDIFSVYDLRNTWRKHFCCSLLRTFHNINTNRLEAISCIKSLGSGLNGRKATLHDEKDWRRQHKLVLKLIWRRTTRSTFDVQSGSEGK